MATIRTLLGLGLVLLCAALVGGWSDLPIAAGELPEPLGSSPVSAGFSAPETAELTAARDLPDRLASAAVLGAPRSAIGRPAAPVPAARTSAPAAGSTPLYLSHCAFLC